MVTASGLVFAAPTLAADDLVPVPQVPAIPEVDAGEAVVPGADSAMPAVAPPPEITTPDPPITISVEAEDGNVDVSVRVLSPVEDEAEAQKGPETAVVSGSDEPDITPDVPSPQPSSDAGADTPATGSNVNVSVRVLSPGVDDPAQQGSPTDDLLAVLETGDPEVEEDQPIPPDSGEIPPKASTGIEVDAVQPSETDQQYHDENSRYQSDSQFEEPTWYWLWFLSMDCDGNTASSSTETGHPSALDWVWAWDWEWACNSPPRPPPLEPLAAGNDTESTSSSTGSTGGSSTQPASVDGDGAAGEPWLWTWTFTFCGQTTSATIPLYVQTQLQWDWDWTWDWTCEETAPDAPPSRSTGTPAPPDAPSSETFPGVDQGSSAPIPTAVANVHVPVWLISLLPVSELAALPPLSVVLELEVPSLLLPDLVSGQSEGLVGGFATTDAIVISPYPHARERAGAARASAMRTRLSAVEPWLAEGGTTTRANAHAAQANKSHSVAPRSKRTPLSPLRAPRPFQSAGGAAGSASSVVPGGSSSGTAALTSFLAFFAPGLGRRIRATRELSPRGTYGSSIDRPG